MCCSVLHDGTKKHRFIMLFPNELNIFVISMLEVVMAVSIRVYIYFSYLFDIFIRRSITEYLYPCPCHTVHIHTKNKKASWIYVHCTTTIHTEIERYQQQKKKKKRIIICILKMVLIFLLKK